MCTTYYRCVGANRMFYATAEFVSSLNTPSVCASRYKPGVNDLVFISNRAFVGVNGVVFTNSTFVGVNGLVFTSDRAFVGINRLVFINSMFVGVDGVVRD